MMRVEESGGEGREAVKDEPTRGRRRDGGGGAAVAQDRLQQRPARLIACRPARGQNKGGGALERATGS